MPDRAEKSLAFMGGVHTRPIEAACLTDPFVADIRVWLSLDPGLTALAIEERLTAQHGSLVSLRTVQRLVKRVRTELLQAEISAVAASHAA
jgi:hypothetical protein